MLNMSNTNPRGYADYQNSLYLSVKDLRLEYGEASSDDLSSDWDTESEDASPKYQAKVCSSEDDVFRLLCNCIFFFYRALDGVKYEMLFTGLRLFKHIKSKNTLGYS